MCGIACIITPSEIGISDNYKYLSQISDMVDMVKHRGPDGNGQYIDTRGVALGHSRLKIIDLSDDANQPMHSIPTITRGKYHIVYNGEIYNYVELRDMLVKKGYFFKTKSDTEVLLNLYIEYGKDCLHHLNGMFSFIIYNECNNTLFAARDRYGIKPFYWWKSPEGVVAFASEIKQFTVLDGWVARANIPIVNDYLRMIMVDHTSETMFVGVYQLRGGEAIEARVEEIMNGAPISDYIYQWYELQDFNNSIQYERAVCETKTLLQDSVRLRCMRSDVPVGSCLSGGIDSSSIVCLANSYYTEKSKQHTFTMGSDDKQYDEISYAKEVINKCDINYHFVFPKISDMLDNLGEIVWYQDEPFTSTSIFGQYEVFRRSKIEGIKVMLDGQGADELFCGYHYVFPVRLFSLLKGRRYAQFFRELIALSSIPGFSYMSLFMAAYNKIQMRYSPSPTHRNIPIDYSTLRSYSQTLLKYTSLPALLHWEDRNSSAHSIEARLPFLDYRLVQRAYSLPDDYKLRNAITKRVLRDAMIHILPNAIRTRKDKIGFQTSEELWVYSNTEKFRKLFYDAMKVSNGLITHEDSTNFENTLMGKIKYDSIIWRCICLGAWIKRFGVSVQS